MVRRVIVGGGDGRGAGVAQRAGEVGRHPVPEVIDREAHVDRAERLHVLPPGMIQPLRPGGVPAAPVVRGDRGLNERLVKSAFGGAAFVPQVFPHLVRLEKLPAIEQFDSGQVARVGRIGCVGRVRHRVYRKKRPVVRERTPIEAVRRRLLHDTRHSRHPIHPMLLSNSKCPLPALVTWCRALRYSLSAGLDPVRIFKQQAKSGPRKLRPLAEELAQKLAAGDSLEDALEPHRNRFPPLFLELVAVGEQTGRLEDTFRELEQYYQTLLSMQRNFRSQMMYPVIQFFAAIFIISSLIWVLGLLGSKMDPTGLGLTGTAGALTFLGLAAGFVGAIVVVLKLAADSVQFRAKMEGMLLWVPGWGPAFLAFAVMRFAVALRMCAEAGLQAELTLHYCFRATANAAFQVGEERAVQVVKRGGELHEALQASGAPFPPEFRESLLMGEETGNTSEVMERLAVRLREEAERKLKLAAQFTGYAIYGAVAIMIIFFIFRIATNVSGRRLRRQGRCRGKRGVRARRRCLDRIASPLTRPAVGAANFSSGIALRARPPSPRGNGAGGYTTPRPTDTHRVAQRSAAVFPRPRPTGRGGAGRMTHGGVDERF